MFDQQKISGAGAIDSREGICGHRREPRKEETACRRSASEARNLQRVREAENMGEISIFDSSIFDSETPIEGENPPNRKSKFRKSKNGLSATIAWRPLSRSLPWQFRNFGGGNLECARHFAIAQNLDDFRPCG